MDGLDAAARITALNVKTPIVALTANVMSNDLEHYKNSGMSDTIGKPFTTHELWECLVKYIPVKSYSVIDKRRQTAEEKEAQKKRLVNFVKDNQTRYDEFMDALNANDIKTAHRIAHTLKSNAGQIGENRLQKAALAVESKLLEGKNLLDEEHIKNFEFEIKSVLEKHSSLLNDNNKEDTEKITDKEKVREIFAKLEPMLININPECEDLIDDMEKISGTEKIVCQIEKFNFSQALDELLILKKEWGID